jgi:hypothetical protein
MTAITATLDQATAAPDQAGTTKTLWAGRILSGLAVAFLALDASFKLLQVPLAAEANAQLGWPNELTFGIGLLEVALLAIYLVPQTSVLGALLWTGYLGGAIATHLRVGNPLLTHTLFPIWVALFVWGGLWLREPRLRALLPVRESN